MCLLLAKEDLQMFADNYEDKILHAFEKFSEAAAIIFGIDIFKDGKQVDSYLTKTQRLGNLNDLKYGTYSVEIHRSSVKQVNIYFTIEFYYGSTYFLLKTSLLTA